VGYDGTTEAKKPQLDPSDVEATGGCLVEDVEIVNIVYASTKFFKNDDILASTPNSKYRYGELELT
jgi:hypothetical protein